MGVRGLTGGWVAQMSVAAQSMSMFALQPSPLIHDAVAHLQMHQVGAVSGHRMLLPYVPP